MNDIHSRALCLLRQIIAACPQSGPDAYDRDVDHEELCDRLHDAEALLVEAGLDPMPAVVCPGPALSAGVAALVADWRQRHPEATCSDRVAATLAALEAQYGSAPRREVKNV